MGAEDDADDLARAAASLTRLGVPQDLTGRALAATQPVTGVRVGLEADVVPRAGQKPVRATVTARAEQQADLPDGELHPGKLQVSTP